jgi:hypothetical protein
MNIDISVVLDYFIPDSISDFGAILLWTLIGIILILMYVDIRTYLYYRKITHTKEKQQRMMITPLQMKQSSDDTMQNLNDIRRKVDALLESKNL